MIVRWRRLASLGILRLVTSQPLASGIPIENISNVQALHDRVDELTALLGQCSFSRVVQGDFESNGDGDQNEPEKVD